MTPSRSAAPAGRQCIDFDELSTGALVTDQYESRGVTFASFNAAKYPLMVFDSSRPTGQDADLGSPNHRCAGGGPGEGVGGEPKPAHTPTAAHWGRS